MTINRNRCRYSRACRGRAFLRSIGNPRRAPGSNGQTDGPHASGPSSVTICTAFTDVDTSFVLGVAILTTCLCCYIVLTRECMHDSRELYVYVIVKGAERDACMDVSESGVGGAEEIPPADQSTGPTWYRLARKAEDDGPLQSSAQPRVGDLSRLGRCGIMRKKVQNSDRDSLTVCVAYGHAPHQATRSKIGWD